MQPIAPGTLCMMVDLPDCNAAGERCGDRRVCTVIRYQGLHKNWAMGVQVENGYEVEVPDDPVHLVVDRAYLIPITGPRAELDVVIEHSIPEVA